MPDFNNDFLRKAEEILANSSLKDSLIALKQFKIACAEADYKDDEITGMVNYLALALFVMHFKLQF